MTQMARFWARHATRGRGLLPLTLLLAGLLVLAPGCGSSSTGTPFGREGPLGPAADAVQFFVKNTAGFPVVGATVYLVPASAVDATVFSGADVLSGAAQDKDEPLEDAIDQNGGSFPQAVTGADGAALLEAVPVDVYFIFVKPSGLDTENLPGGDASRLAVSATTFLGLTRDLVVSSKPPAAAVYAGTSVCLSCHQSYSTFTQHAHRLGFAVPGQFSALQDPTRYPDYTGMWDRFLPSATPAGGTVVYFSDYDGSRGFDKFKTSLTDPSPGETVYAKAYLWRDTGDGKYKVTLENVITPADAMSPWTMEVALTYGGTLYKQRNLLVVAGRKGRYPFLQWQSAGDEANFDRTRKVFRDYHLDWYWDTATNTFKLPPVNKTFEGNCTSCHSTGFTRFQDGVTGEWLSGAQRDNNGAFDINGDGFLNEINIGCEVCHGPGNLHIDWVLNQAGPGQGSRYIVTPQNLNAARSNMICGRCHDRVTGFGGNPNDEPLNSQNQMMMPGARRADYVANYADRDGPGLNNLWVDEYHSKSHRQHYADFIKGNMSRNGRVLTVCGDCHDSHGYGQFENHLKYDPRDPDSLLCQNCHAVPDIGAHTLAVTGLDHTVIAIDCADCHMVKAAKTGAGTMGRTTGGPPFVPLNTYWENDITSHLFVGVPSKSNPGVDGVVPGSAMPIPYTNSCAFCHNVGALYPKPGVAPLTLPEVPADD